MNQDQTQFIIDFVAVDACNFNASTPIYDIGGAWSPAAKLDIDVVVEKKLSNQYKVSLITKVAVNLNDDPVFSVEVTTVGLFSIIGYEDAEIERLTEVYCPNILFPYARETVARLVIAGGFPQLHLNPIDFEARYRMIKGQEE